jgi:hypothetical protein
MFCCNVTSDGFLHFIDRVNHHIKRLDSDNHSTLDTIRCQHESQERAKVENQEAYNNGLEEIKSLEHQNSELQKFIDSSQNEGAEEQKKLLTELNE